MNDVADVLSIGDEARAAMLRLARAAQANGMIYQAIHTYNHLLEQYPRTDESRVAALALLRLARFLEQQGQYHTAMSLYLHLEAIS